MNFTIATTTVSSQPVQTVNAREVHASNMSYLHETLIYKHGEYGAASLIINELLETAASIGYKTALRVFDDLKELCSFPTEIHRIIHAAEHELMRAWILHKDASQPKKILESDVQKFFFDNLGTFIPGAKKHELTRFLNSIPDGFVSINEEVIPVEVKLNAFNEPALSQLLGYMRKYKTERGIAVAKICTVTLPECISFIQVDHEIILQAVLDTTTA